MSDFADVFGEWLTHSVEIAPYLGDGFDGPTFGAAVTRDDVMVEDVRRLVRGADGNERTSETTLYVPLPAEIDEHARIVVDGRTRVAVRIAKLDAFGLPGHVVVNLE